MSVEVEGGPSGTAKEYLSFVQNGIGLLGFLPVSGDWPVNAVQAIKLEPLPNRLLPARIGPPLIQPMLRERIH